MVTTDSIELTSNNKNAYRNEQGVGIFLAVISFLIAGASGSYANENIRQVAFVGIIAGIVLYGLVTIAKEIHNHQ